MHTPPMILIADDEADTLALLKRICQRAQYDVQIALDGQQAWQMASQLLPDLVLLDVQMPYLNGFEVVEKLRQHPQTAQIPIIVITAAATKPEDIAHGIDIGADDYIPKPFNYQELMARMRAKLRAKELEEHLQRRTDELEMLVQMGIKLNYPLPLSQQAEELVAFLCEKFGCPSSLFFIPAKDAHQEVYRQMNEYGQLHHEKQAPLLDFLPPNEEVLLLTSEETQRIFGHSVLQSGIVGYLPGTPTPLGLIALGQTAPDFFDASHVQVMRSVCQHIALAVSNAHLYESLQGYANELEDRVQQRTQELQAAQNHLIRSEKLASLGRLAGEIAHEINNPLQPIMTCLEGAIEDLEANLPVDLEDLKMAMDEVQRLKRIVTRLLDFARPDTSRTITLNLDYLVNEVLALIRKKLAATKIQVQTNLNPVEPIQANTDQLKQVILNIMINAVDAMSENAKQDNQLSIHLWQTETDIHLTIRDTGIGMPVELTHQIFDPFFSTKENGSGLGLAISHTIIEAHGGKILVTSELGQGSEFHLSLPLT